MIRRNLCSSHRGLLCGRVPAGTLFFSAMKTMLPLLLALVAPILVAGMPAPKESNTERASPAPRIAKKSMDSVAGYVFGATEKSWRTDSCEQRITPKVPWILYSNTYSSYCWTYETHRTIASAGVTYYDGRVYYPTEPIPAPRHRWCEVEKHQGTLALVEMTPLIGCFYLAIPEAPRGKVSRVLIYGDPAHKIYSQKNAGKRAGRESETLSKIKSEGKRACASVFSQLKNYYDFISKPRFSDKDPIITAYETDGMGKRLRRIEFFMYPLDCPMMIAITDIAQEAADRAAEKPKADASGWRL